jgi:hypothetical protein
MPKGHPDARLEVAHLIQLYMEAIDLFLRAAGEFSIAEIAGQGGRSSSRGQLSIGCGGPNDMFIHGFRAFAEKGISLASSKGGITGGLYR